ncbi:DUF3603 family protein [Amphibacillus sediminis]|uniref:DUF3603 family protein n=1 Tax=Amphibacillus sediminis TaxID=360185 RepID=UPI000834D87E|nr:DUF3603 family protein [Amphibacillus sediminis]
MMLQDVWVNWFEGEENGYNVCSFYEWRKQDKIELIDTMPVLYIESHLYNYIENHLDDLPAKLLDQICDQTLVKGEPLRYAAIVTDGSGVLVFDTMGYRIPLKKSRLIPRQERRVLHMVSNQSRLYYSLKKAHFPKKEHHMFSLAPEAMVGLIRRERELKQLTMLALDSLRQGCNRDEVLYWLTEWEPDQYESICKLTFEQAWNKLYQHVYHGWGKQHELFCQAIIKGEPLFEQLWQKAHENDNSPQLKRMK